MRKPITVAYLEDTPEQSGVVAKWFSTQAIQCHVYESAEAMRAALASISFDAIMLDVDINGETAGLAMLDHIRQTYGDDTPILVVSAKAHGLKALGSGADDFLEKPLNAKKLLTHLHALLRPVAQEAAIESYPPYQLNTLEQQITVKGNPVNLSDEEYELAAMLFRHFGKVLSYSQLMDSLSNQRVNRSARKLESELFNLKRKMDLRDADGWRLESIYRHGFRLVDNAI